MSDDLSRLKTLWLDVQKSGDHFEASLPASISFLRDVERAVEDDDAAAAGHLLARRDILSINLRGASGSIRLSAEMAPETTRRRLLDMAEELDFYAVAFEGSNAKA